MVAPFFHEMAKNANYPPPLQSAFPGGPQSDSHKMYQTCLSEGAGLAWAHIKRHMHVEVRTYVCRQVEMVSGFRGQSCLDFLFLRVALNVTFFLSYVC